MKGTGVIRYCHPFFKRDFPELLSAIKKNGKNDFLTNFDEFIEKEVRLDQKEMAYMCDKEIEELNSDNILLKKELERQEEIRKTLTNKLAPIIHKNFNFSLSETKTGRIKKLSNDFLNKNVSNREYSISDIEKFCDDIIKEVEEDDFCNLDVSKTFYFKKNKTQENIEAKNLSSLTLSRSQIRNKEDMVLELSDKLNESFEFTINDLLSLDEKISQDLQFKFKL